MGNVPWLDKDGCKGLGGSAVGYWGRDINRRISADNTTGKELADLRDEIEAGGVLADLWIGVKSGNVCSCYKKSHRSSDRKCKSCHGVRDGYVPGYLKWGFKTIWMSPTDSDVTLTNVETTRDFQSSQLSLISGALSGTIESSDKVFSRTAVGSSWDVDFSTCLRNPIYSSVSVQYSLNSGLVWKDISELVSENPVSGVIRFKATLTRDNVNVLSPFFEIVRARYEELDYKRINADGTYEKGPYIKIIKTVPEEVISKSEYGDFPNVNGLSFWTVGLSYFDNRIIVGSDDEKLEGPNVFIEFREGALKGRRFVVTSWSLSDPRGFTVMTQTFKLREEDSVSPLSLVW